MLMLLDDYQLMLRNDIQMILHVLPILDVWKVLNFKGLKF